MCLAGAAIGSISGAGLAEKFGRKGTLVLDTVPLLAGAVVMATATSLNALIAGRVLAGIGIGLASAIVPLYISEVARPAVPCSFDKLRMPCQLLMACATEAWYSTWACNEHPSRVTWHESLSMPLVCAK